MSDINLKWKNLDEWRLIAEHHAGFNIIAPIDDPGAIPLACPLCSLLMKGHEDVMAYKRSQVCSSCMCLWYDCYKQKWENGWRPPQSVVDQERKKRLLMPAYLVT